MTIPHEGLLPNHVHIIPGAELEMTHMEAAALNVFAHRVAKHLVSATPRAVGDRFELTLSMDYEGWVLVNSAIQQAAIATKRIYDRSGLEAMVINDTDAFHSPNIKIIIIDDLPVDRPEGPK